jgi:CRP-like cAMP-binding protein
MSLNPIHRVAILKTVSLFAETPEGALEDVARLLEEVAYPAGVAIFEKGDLGDCLYAISMGRVRVHDGEMTLNFLGVGDVFGEMAAIDPEPRSASVTAVEDTQLLRLDQESLLQLMDRHPEVTRGILHILSQHLRARMRDMAEDFEYMQQFAKVTSAAAAVEAGIYNPESIDQVAARKDELGQLARVFQRMVRQVHAREASLKEQVADLRVEIDEIKKARQVAEITETQYFQQLRSKAQRIRSSRSGEGD